MSKTPIPTTQPKMEKNTGGPAFPVPNDANVNGQEGMTLRDYLAAKAMQGLIPDPKYDNATGLAQDAYRTADAMLKAREQ